MVNAIKGGYAINLGGFNAAVDHTANDKRNIKLLMAKAQQGGGLQNAGNRFEFRLKERDGQQVLQLKTRNWASKFKSAINMRSTERRQERLDAAVYLSNQYDLELNIPKTALSKEQARVIATQFNQSFDQLKEHQDKLEQCFNPTETKPPRDVSLSSIHPTVFNIMGHSVPLSMAFRAGPEGREFLNTDLRKNLISRDKDNGYKPLADDLRDDPRAHQMLIDFDRCDIIFSGAVIAKNGPGGYEQLRQNLRGIFADQPHKAENSFRDLSHLLTQEGIVGCYAVAAQFSKPGVADWFGNVDKKNSLRIYPEGSPSKSMLIVARCESKGSSFTYKSQPIPLVDGSGVEVPLKDHVFIKVRYTPSAEAQTLGDIQVLDASSAFQILTNELLSPLTRDQKIDQYKSDLVEWLNSTDKNYETDLALLRKTNDSMLQWFEHEQDALTGLGREPMGLEDFYDTHSEVLQNILAVKTPKQLALLRSRVLSSPALPVLAGTFDLLNDVLGKFNNLKRTEHLDELNALVMFSLSTVNKIQKALGSQEELVKITYPAEGTEMHSRIQRLIDEVPQ